jgi:hypothetical protein
MNSPRMKFVRCVFLLVGLLSIIGCATEGWQAEEVPLPRSTPFDSNQFARNAYLEGFRQGYTAQSSGGPTAVETVSGPYAEARRHGFYAGAAQARAQQSGAIK